MTLDSRRHSLQRQQGNTLTGIIIGLVIGLAIAVVVALAITKGSTPFTDKSGKVGKAAEPTVGQISDPNKPLYGSKDAAREANKEFTKDAPPPPGIVPAPAATPAPTAAVPAKPEPNPLAAKPAAPATPPAAVPAKPDAAPADDKVVYYLQAGAFREVGDAESARAKLALLGFEATVTDRASDNGVLHRVRLGPYSQVDAMNKARNKLAENGVDVAVVRNQK